MDGVEGTQVEKKPRAKRRSSQYMALEVLGENTESKAQGYEELCTGASPKACKKLLEDWKGGEFIIVRLHGRFKATAKVQMAFEAVK